MPDEDQSAPRHMVTSSLTGKYDDVIVFGCSQCHWQFHPVSRHTLQEALLLWTVQVAFEAHDCTRFLVDTRDEQKNSKGGVGM
jgi:hypothetical protein